MEKKIKPELSLAFEYGSKQCLLCFLSISEFINGRYYTLTIGCKGYFHDHCAEKLEHYEFVKSPFHSRQTPDRNQILFLPWWREPPF